MNIEFTTEDISRIERIYNVKWDELSEIKKLMLGSISKNIWSPEAISNYIIYGEDRTKWPDAIDK